LATQHICYNLFMPDQGLLSFIKGTLAQGKSKQEISAILIAQGGWNQQDVDMAFAQIAPPSVPPAPAPVPVPPSALTPTVAVSPDFTPPTSFIPTQPVRPIQSSPANPIQPLPKIVVSPMVADPQFRAKKKGKWGLLLFVVITLFVLGAAGASAYYYLLPILASHPDPKTEIGEALANTLNLDAFSYSASYAANVSTTTTASSYQVAVFATTTGAFDFTQSQPSVDAHLQLSGSMAEETGNSPSTVNGSLDFEIRFLNKTGYFILNGLSIRGGNSSTAMIQGIVAGVASAIEGKWIEATSTPYAASTLPDTATISADKKLLVSKLQSLDFISSISQLADATVNGVATYHYSMVLDPNKLQADVASMASSSAALGQNYKSSPVTIELFIGKKDTYIYEYLVPQQSVTTAGSEAVAGGAMTMGNFNQPAGITAPANAIPLQTLLASYLGQTTPTNTQAKIQGEMDEMRNAAEIYYGNHQSYGASYKGSLSVGKDCSVSAVTGSKLFSDSASGMSLLVGNVLTDVGTSSVDCGNTPKAWSVAAKLPDASYFCVDSTGVARSVSNKGVAYTALVGASSAVHKSAGATSCN